MQFAKDFGAGWRAEIADSLKSMNYYPIDIALFDRLYAEQHGDLIHKYCDLRTVISEEDSIQTRANIRRHFVHADLKLISDACDALIVLYNEAARRGAGTISEVQHAYDHDIPIFLVSYYDDWTKEVPGWLQATATKSFTTFESLLEYLDNLPRNILIKDVYGNRCVDQEYLCSLCGDVFSKNKHHFVSKVDPLYCKSCVEIVTETYEGVEDRYNFFLKIIEQEEDTMAAKVKRLDELFTKHCKT